jgi:probable phosphoglycerate mutase
MPTRFCLMRHGETDWNVEHRIQGQIDVPLNATGRAQADAAARELAAQTFSSVYSSDLTRALATANAVAGPLGLDVESTPALRERHFGAFQGLTHREAQARYPADYARFRDRRLAHGLPGGGESLPDFAARVEAVLNGMADKHEGEMLLVVTHGGALDVAHRLAAGQSLHAKRDFLLPNAALNWIERRNGQWELLSWAERSHLKTARGALDAAPD